MEEWDHYEFLNITMTILSAIAAIVLVRNRNRNKSFRFFYIYPFSSFLQSIIYHSVTFPNYPDSYNPINISSILFLNIEFFIFAKYYFEESNFKLSRLVIVATVAIYSCWVLTSILIFPLHTCYLILYGWQSCAIIILVLIYIFEIFRAPPKANLFNEPSFWFSIAASLVSLGLTPIIFSLSFIFDRYAYINQTLAYSLNFIIYTLCFAILIRGCLCPVPEKKEKNNFNKIKLHKI